MSEQLEARRADELRHIVDALEGLKKVPVQACIVDGLIDVKHQLLALLDKTQLGLEVARCARESRCHGVCRGFAHPAYPVTVDSDGKFKRNPPST